RWELEVVVPRVLEFLRRRDLTITFFIVGQDAALAKNHAALRSIADAGHEIGSHSFLHEPWMQNYSREKIEAEITAAEEHIENATGRRPIGFRCPGLNCLSRATLQTLVQRGYFYDASTFPSHVLPLARALYFATTKLSPEQRRERRALGGTVRDGFRPLRPYRWQMGNGTLIEVPVTTMPVLRVPIHFTYLLYLRAI